VEIMEREGNLLGTKVEEEPNVKDRMDLVVLGSKEVEVRSYMDTMVNKMCSCVIKRPQIAPWVQLVQK